MHGSPPRLPPFVRRPRAAAPTVVQVGELISIGGVLYRVGATLIPEGAAPTPAPIPTPVPVPVPPPVPIPVPVPPPPPPVNCPLPLVSGYRDWQRNWLVPPDWALTGGTVAFVDGTCFGSVPGKLLFNGTPLVVASWSDMEIRFTAPVKTAATPPGWGIITVQRADGVSQGFRGFSVR